MRPQASVKSDHMIYQRSYWFRPSSRKLALCVIALACPTAISFSQVPSPTSPSPGAAAPAASASSSQIAAGATEVKPEQPGTNAEHLINEAINRAARLDSAAADMVQTVEMLNQKVTIKGHYLKAPGYRLYLGLTVEGAAETNLTMVQVCDGETLWDFREVFDSRVFTSLSIKPVLERLASPDLDGNTKDLTITQMGFAGTESLLAGLRKYYKFHTVEKEENLLDGKAVWIMHGTWTTTPGVLAPEARPTGPQGVLPPYIPGTATLYLGKEDYWPYKLVMAGENSAVPLDTRRRGLNGEPIGARSSIEKFEPTRIVLNYSHVKLNDTTIPADQFKAPTPAGVVVADRTEAMTKSLDQAISAEVDKKKRESIRDAEPLQGPPIQIEIPPAVETLAPR